MINFYKCLHCGNIVMFLESSGVIPTCCGDPMTQLKPGTSDGSGEKHLPVITVHKDDVIVTVGSMPHPMETEHHIKWIVLETNRGMHVSYLSAADEKATAGFTLQKGERVVAAYEYCNLHGLWMTGC